MKSDGTGERLTIFLEETDHHGHQPVYAELVERAREAGLAGASVFRGIEGFGASAHLHEAHVVSLEDDVPLVVVIVDEPDRIDAFVAATGDLLAGALVLREPVRTITYRRGSG